jgi:phage host-nuclease inhibitor protein Gam
MITASTIPAPASAGDAERLLIQLVKLTAEREVIEAKATKKIADIFEIDATRMGEIDTDTRVIEKYLKEYASSLLDEKRIFPNGTKTLSFIAGSVAVNAGKPKIEFLDGFGDASALQRVDELKIKGITRTPPQEIDKDSVMAALSDGRLTPEQLVKLGLKKSQDETITVKVVSVEALRKASSKKKSNAKA